MNTVRQLEQALAEAQRQGYKLRQECLDGVGGGACEIRGEKWLFLDLTLSPAEQLEVVLAAIGRSIPRATLQRPTVRAHGQAA
jgi:hypothetical protein